MGTRKFHSCNSIILKESEHGIGKENNNCIPDHPKEEKKCYHDCPSDGGFLKQKDNVQDTNFLDYTL